MLRTNLGFRCKKYASHVSLFLKSAIYLLPATAVFTVMPAKAAYVCKQYESCAMVERMFYWERVCKPSQSCTWVPDVPSTPPSTTPPPSSMPPTWTPPPPSSPPPPPPVIKSPEEIEWEQHVKFCKEYPGQISTAVKQCQDTARGYFSYFVGTKCPLATSQTWSVSSGVKDIFGFQFSQTVEPGPTCRANAELARDDTIRACAASGDKYMAALGKQCSDVH